MKADPEAHEQAKAGKRPKAKAAPKPKPVAGDRKAERAAPKPRRLDPLEALRALDAAWPADPAAWAAGLPAFHRRDLAAISARLRERLQALEAVLSNEA
jgi:hypothetical protein